MRFPLIVHWGLIQSAEAFRVNSKTSLLVIVTIFYKINMNTEPFLPGEIQAQVQKSLKLRKHNNDRKNEKKIGVLSDRIWVKGGSSS